MSLVLFSDWPISSALFSSNSIQIPTPPTIVTSALMMEKLSIFETLTYLPVYTAEIPEEYHPQRNENLKC
jgi:hypothetical protein